MPILLSHPLSIQEIRVLQEFRRLTTDTLTMEKIRGIRHPVGGGEEPAVSLVGKGYLTADDAGENFALTDKAKSFLAIDYKPLPEGGGSAGEPA